MGLAGIVTPLAAALLAAQRPRAAEPTRATRTPARRPSPRRRARNDGPTTVRSATITTRPSREALLTSDSLTSIKTVIEDSAENTKKLNPEMKSKIEQDGILDAALPDRAHRDARRRARHRADHPGRLDALLVRQGGPPTERPRRVLRHGPRRRRPPAAVAGDAPAHRAPSAPVSVALCHRMIALGDLRRVLRRLSVEEREVFALRRRGAQRRLVTVAQPDGKLHACQVSLPHR